MGEAEASGWEAVKEVEMIAMGALSVLFLPAPIMHSYTNAFEVVRAEGYHLEDIGHHAVLPRDRERSWPCAHQRLDGGTNPCLFDALMISIRFGRGRWKRIRI